MVKNGQDFYTEICQKKNFQILIKYFWNNNMHILLPALPWKATENWLTSLQFTAGVYIEWKNHESLGSWILPRGWSHKCSKCDEDRPLEERMMTDGVKGVHTPDIREFLNSATQLSQWESAAATWVSTHTTLYPWPLTSKRDCPSYWQYHRTLVPCRGLCFWS